jgi:AraC-like DNA-binding protein
MVMDVFQVTPKQLLMKRRIDKACQLLEETDRSIAAVSAACGYCDHSAFTRQFKIATQVTPAQYRASLKPPVTDGADFARLEAALPTE